MKQNRLKVKIASYLILIRDNKILMTRRFNTGWSDGMFSLPSGHIDPKEYPIQTIVREALEEINVKIKLKDTKIVHIHFEKDQYVGFYFQSTKWTGNLKINEPEKCDKITWVNIDEIDSYKIPKQIKIALLSIINGEYYSQSD